LFQSSFLFVVKLGKQGSLPLTQPHTIRLFNLQHTGDDDDDDHHYILFIIIIIVTTVLLYYSSQEGVVLPTSKGTPYSALGFQDIFWDHQWQVG